MSVRIHLPRGVVTFLFTDIEGSTRLAQMLGSEYRSVLTGHRRLLRRTLTASGGNALFSEGDSLFVAFHDAGAALAACAEAQRALAGHDWPGPQARPRVRMGLHTGWAQPRRGEYASLEVHRAARVCAAAHGGQVLCSGATAEQAMLPAAISLLDVGLHRLRGFDRRERLYQLIAPGLDRHFPRPRTPEAVPHNLPVPVTSLVGRVTERADLTALIEQHRLVDVVGPAGVGKSRLALEVAAGRVDAYHDGVWYVDLAEQPVAGADPALVTGGLCDLVAGSVAAGLGLRPEPGRPILDTLTEYLAPRRMLLALDTCDAQPLAAARVVTRLLRAGPGIRVLATGREPLKVPGEVVYRVAPLSLVSPAEGGPSEAVTLLRQRAAAATGGRRPTGSEAEHLDRIAQQLSGLPLALELAAGRLGVLSAAELTARLEEPAAGPGVGLPGSVVEPTTLGAGQAAAGDAASRHASLGAALDWSYRSLPPAPARLLRWMSVFAGPVDHAAIGWLVGTDPIDALAVLVDKSLVEPDLAGDRSTYRLLGPVRAYAAGHLVAQGEQGAARQRHVAWCLRAVQVATGETDSRVGALSMYSFDPLTDDVDAALRWSATSGSARQGLRLVTALDPWWAERGLAREVRGWLYRLRERISVTGEDVPPDELAAAYATHARNAALDGDHDEATRFWRRAEATAHRADQPALLARVLAERGVALIEAGEAGAERARLRAERACRGTIAWADARGVGAEALPAVYGLAWLWSRRGALDEAADLLGRARLVEATRPVPRARRTVDLMLGVVALERHDLVAAHEHLVVALRARIAGGYHGDAAEALRAFASRTAEGGDPATAAVLFGAAQAALTRLRRPGGASRDYWDEQQAALRDLLGDAAFDTAYARGAGLELEAAATLALAVEHPDLAAGSARFSDLDSRIP